MTVITFAKRGLVLTSFGAKSAMIRHSTVAIRRRDNALSFEALVAFCGAAAIIAAVIFGIYSSILTIAMSKNAAEVFRFEQELERFRVEAMMLSSPQAIIEKARALQLKESTNPARHVILDFPENLAAKY
jgi:hypothetical protein